MLSPSPYSLAVWTILAISQARVLLPYSWKDYSWREWIKAFTVCAFTLGFIVLPFDSLWVFFQSMRFGYLFPDERCFTLFSSLLRNVLILLLCIYETREVHKHLNWTAFLDFIVLIPIMIFWFIYAPDPSWTDWTYAWRFGYGGLRTFYAFLISHGLMKFIQAFIYVDLWRVKVEG